MNERYSRQQDIISQEILGKYNPTIIGVGAIGRQVALQLTAIGVSSLHLVDFDRVEESNLTSQGYLQDDLGRYKVDATADICQQLNHQLDVKVNKERFKRTMPMGNCIFCCVDSIATRKLIWDVVKDDATFFIDGRMSAESLRIISVTHEKSRITYPLTFFGSNEAYQGSCTAKTTIYCANIAAGVILSQFTKYLRQMPLDFDLQLNLLTSEITVSNPG